MTSDELILELEKIFPRTDRYDFLEYINKNKGVFISAISIVSAIVLFTARAISYLVVREKYRFWDLDEGFLVEDNKALLKLGVYVLYFFLITLLSSFAKRYVYRWEFYNSEIYLLNKTFTYSNNELKEHKKKITKNEKALASVKKNKKKVAKLIESATLSKKNTKNIAVAKSLLASIEKENEALLSEHLQDKKDYEKVRKYGFSIRKDIWKLRSSFIFRIFLVMLGVFIASILVFLISGVENWDNGIASLLVSAGIITLLIMFTAFLCAFCEIRLTIKIVLKRSFEDKKIDWNSDSIHTVIKWLRTKIDEYNNQSIKFYFSDKSLKALLINVIFTTIAMTIFLQFNMNYNLKRMNTFYVIREDQQDYVMLVNDGTKYIFSECEINDNKLIIDTNKIIVRKEQVSLEKIQFESVERKQHIESNYIKVLQETEESQNINS